MKRVLLLVLLIAFGFTSCQKGNLIIDKSSSIKQDNSPAVAMMVSFPGMITTSAANSDNPYDYYGAIHNNLIVATENVWQDTTNSLEDIYSALVATSIDTVANPPSLDTFTSQINYSLDHLNDLQFIVSHSSLSLLGKQYADSLAALISHWVNYASYGDFKTAVELVETGIMNDSLLAQADKQMLLKMTSICRYSIKYWVNYTCLILESSNQSGLNTGTGMSPNSWVGDAWNAVKGFVVKHKDVIGPAVGADVGATITVILGPAGPITIAGASIAAGVAAIIKIIL